MCYVCEDQFTTMSTQFNEAFAEYLDIHRADGTRDTPGERVHDLAFEHQELCESENGRIIVSWFLAVTIERLVALECAGIPT